MLDAPGVAVSQIAADPASGRMCWDGGGGSDVVSPIRRWWAMGDPGMKG
jgi:hypothetical protein